MTNRYEIRKHIGCGGDLTFEKEVVENKILNKRAVEKFGAKAKIKQVTKNMFRCNKCRELVNVVTCPSWEQFVLWGKIRVSKKQYWEIKENRKNGALRY